MVIKKQVLTIAALSLAPFFLVSFPSLAGTTHTDKTSSLHASSPSPSPSPSPSTSNTRHKKTTPSASPSPSPSPSPSSSSSSHKKPSHP